MHDTKQKVDIPFYSGLLWAEGVGFENDVTQQAARSPPTGSTAIDSRQWLALLAMPSTTRSRCNPVTRS
jgi:hypothetical protein